MSTLVLYSPAGAVPQRAAVRLAARRLAALGFEVTIDEAALVRNQRFAGDDETRLAAIHRIARAAPSIAMATRGGYGTTRLLDRLDWKLIAKSVERGTRWVGHSDLTAMQLAAIAHQVPPGWHGPMAAGEFGADEVDEVMQDCFLEAMRGELEAVGFRTAPGFDGLDVGGTLWGGNLEVLCALLGTPHWPKIKGGVLFLEDVGEHPYRLERRLLQLLQAGVLGAQKAVVLGHFVGWKPTPNDRGYNLKTMIDYLRSQTRVPVLTGLPFGHAPFVATKVCLPQGRRVRLAVAGRDAFIAWGHHHD